MWFLWLLISILLIIVFAMILVLLHELGHLVFAKMMKMYVIEYSIGVGKPVFQFKIGETTYSLRWIPTGGYVSVMSNDLRKEIKRIQDGVIDQKTWNEFVKSLNPIDLEKDYENVKNYEDVNPWKRFIFSSGGLIVNSVLAFLLLFTLYATVGVEVSTGKMIISPVKVYIENGNQVNQIESKFVKDLTANYVNNNPGLCENLVLPDAPTTTFADDDKCEAYLVINPQYNKYANSLYMVEKIEINSSPYYNYYDILQALGSSNQPSEITMNLQIIEVSYDYELDELGPKPGDEINVILSRMSGDDPVATDDLIINMINDWYIYPYMHTDYQTLSTGNAFGDAFVDFWEYSVLIFTFWIPSEYTEYEFTDEDNIVGETIDSIGTSNMTYSNINNAVSVTYLIFLILAIFSAILFLFNIAPIPPLDGWKMLDNARETITHKTFTPQQEKKVKGIGIKLFIIYLIVAICLLIFL